MSTGVLTTGVTGYMGSALAAALLGRGHPVKGLVRAGSEGKCPAGVEAVAGSALQAGDVAAALRGCDTLVHLVGTPHPAPWKQRQFESVDGASLAASVEAARNVGGVHLVYVSVAHPAPMMRGYIAVRRGCESLIQEAGLAATILRPWYVLGPGHRWPYLLLPFYRLAERVPSTREGARRLGLVTLETMVRALTAAVEDRPNGVRIWAVPELRAIAASNPSWRRRCPGEEDGVSGVRATGPA